MRAHFPRRYKVRNELCTHSVQQREPGPTGSREPNVPMSTPPERAASARQESMGHVVAPGDAGESTHVRRLAPESRADASVDASAATTGRGSHLRAIDGRSGI